MSASSATALTAPTVAAKLGSGNVTATNDVLVFADSQTDADAFADATSGGIVNIQAELVADARVTTNSDSDPTASALVEGGFVQAGNTLTISANHGGPVPELSDGTIGSVQTGANTLTFSLPHGVQTGDTVVYSAPAWGGPAPSAEDVANGVAPNPNAIGGLGDGRTYGVITTSTTALQLGISFNAASVVDPNKAALSFAREHFLETGDRVIYTCTPGDEVGTRPAAGLLCNQTYYVYKIDEFKVRLSTSPLAPGGSTVFSFDPSGAAAPTSTSRARPASRTARRWSTARRRRSRSPATWSTSRSTATETSSAQVATSITRRTTTRSTRSTTGRSAPTSTTASRWSTPRRSSRTTRRRRAWSCSAA